MMSKFGLTSVSTLLILTVLAACGGGGGGGGGGSAAAPAGIVPRFAYVANYNDNTVSIYTVNAATGQLRHNGYVAAGTNPVSVTVDPTGKFAYVANFGGGVSAYTINAGTGALTQIDAIPGFGGIDNFPAGTNPRSVTVDPTGKFAYVANWGSNSVSAYTITAATGALTALVDVDAGTPGNQSSIAAGANPISVTIDPFGKFVYVANNGSNSVSAYTINATGALTALADVDAGTPGNQSSIAAGTNPVTVTVDPFGKFVYVANLGGGVTAYSINATTGALTSTGIATAGTGPCSVSVDPSGTFVYVANTTSHNVSAFSIDAATGALTALVDVDAGSPGIQLSIAAGTNPEFVTVDPSGKFVYVSNYTSNTVSAYRIDAATGALTALRTVAGRYGNYTMAMSKGAAAVTYTPKFAYVANRTSNDVSAYTINATTGALTSIGAPVAAGTSSFSVTVDPFGKFAYVVNTINSIWVYTINAGTGALTNVGTVLAASIPSSVTVDPSSRFAYVADFNFNNVAAYTINATTGALTSVGNVATGLGPTAVTVDPSGRFAYVANQLSSNVSAYTINATTGALTSVGAAVAAGTNPVSVTIDPSGKFVYVANANSDNVSAYTINASTGALLEIDQNDAVAGTAVAAGTRPVSVTVDPSGKFAYVANVDSDNIWAYAINATTGVLRPAYIVAAGARPRSVTIDSSGKFAYVADFNFNNILAYSLDAATGAMTNIGTVAAGTSPASITTTGTIQ